MIHTLKTQQSEILDKRNSISSESPLPELVQEIPESAVEALQKSTSFHFIETCPSTLFQSQKLPIFEESISSMNKFPSDSQPLWLKHHKSNGNSTAHHILQENEEQLFSNRGTSMNLIGNPSKVLEEDALSRKRSAPIANNVTFADTDDDRDNENIGDQKLLFETPSSEDGLDKKRQFAPAKKSWFTSYRERKEEKRKSMTMSPKNSSPKSKAISPTNKGHILQIDEDEKNDQEFQLNIHPTINQESVRSPVGRSSRQATIIPGNLTPLQDMSPQSVYHSPTSPFNLQFSHRVDDTTRLNLNPQPQVRSWQAISPEDEYAILETKLYLKRACSLFVAIGLLFLTSMLAADGIISPEILFIVALLYLSYYMGENIVRACHYQRESWREVEDNYNIFDAISGGIFVMTVMLKLSKIVSVSMISFIPFMSTLTAYIMLSKPPKAVKRVKMLTKSFYTLQVFLITAKLDKIIELNWEIILAPSCLYIGIITITATISAFNEVRNLLRNVINRRAQRNIKLSVEFLGTMWRLLCCSLSILGFIALITWYRAYLGKSSDSLKHVATTGLVISISLAIYTVIAFKPLTQFLKRDHRFYMPLVEESPQAIIKPQASIDLKVEKQKSYFVMLSSTYFLPLKQSFTARKEENIKRIKKMIKDLSDWRSPRHRNKNAQSPRPKNIEDLKNDKDALDGMFEKLSTFKSTGISPRPVGRTPRVKILTMVNTKHHGDNADNNEQAIITTIGTLESHRKQNLSADDFQFNNILQMKTVKTVEENLCYLCFDSPPNAVLMQCGHGGICYECANALVKKKNECMECRCTVEAIYKVDVNKNLNDIVRGVEITKVSAKP